MSPCSCTPRAYRPEPGPDTNPVQLPASIPLLCDLSKDFTLVSLPCPPGDVQLIRVPPSPPRRGRVTEEVGGASAEAWEPGAGWTPTAGALVVEHSVHPGP